MALNGGYFLRFSRLIAVLVTRARPYDCCLTALSLQPTA